MDKVHGQLFILSKFALYVCHLAKMAHSNLSSLFSQKVSEP